MINLPTTDIKQHGNTPLSESRQGEALAMPIPDTRLFEKHFYIESYGCQMNFNDSEIVASILNEAGFGLTKNYEEADLIFLNTCSIREKAEQRIRNRLKVLNLVKRKRPATKIGILGCMAERLKKKLLEQEQVVDMVVGPDAYRTIPDLITETESGQKAVNVLLSREETYAEITPIRLDNNGITAFVSIMRGCDNMCSFCVVPFTRGRERSRNAFSIVAEVQDLIGKGYKEVTLLGQNVDSYKWKNPETGEMVHFHHLLEMVALTNPRLRVRFSTSHPKDMTDHVLHTMSKYDNICEYIHLPIQSGNSRILKKMNRTYDRAWYLDRIHAIRRIMPNCAISTDIITGFCSETEAEHQDTISMMNYVRYELAYMFMYSERPGTLAARRYEDDIPTAVKKRRLQEVINLQMKHSLERNQADVGKTVRVLVEKPSKRSNADLCGRNDQNKMVIFPRENYQKGDYVDVLVDSCSAVVLKGKAIGYSVFA